jgi:integral membrane protein
MNVKTSFGILRLSAILEGISYLLFALTMPLKYMYEIKMPNKIVGLIHGGLFIAYILFVFIESQEKKWSLSEKFWSYLASLLPFATFIVDKKIFMKYQNK